MCKILFICDNEARNSNAGTMVVVRIEPTAKVNCIEFTAAATVAYTSWNVLLQSLNTHHWHVTPQEFSDINNDDKRAIQPAELNKHDQMIRQISFAYINSRISQQLTRRCMVNTIFIRCNIQEALLTIIPPIEEQLTLRDIPGTTIDLTDLGNVLVYVQICIRDATQLSNSFHSLPL